MNHKLSVLISKQLIKLGAVPQEQKDIYVYGLELIFSFLFCVATIFAVSLFVHKTIEALVFMVLFVLIRQFTGGLHANTYLKCQLYTIGGYLSVAFLSSKLLPSFALHVILIMVGIVIIIAIGPIENEKKPLTPQDRARNKKIGVALFGSAGIGGIATVSVHPAISSTIFYSLLLIIILMIIPYMERRE